MKTFDKDGSGGATPTPIYTSTLTVYIHERFPTAYTPYLNPMLDLSINLTNLHFNPMYIWPKPRLTYQPERLIPYRQIPLIPEPMPDPEPDHRPGRKRVHEYVSAGSLEYGMWVRVRVRVTVSQVGSLDVSMIASIKIKHEHQVYMWKCARQQLKLNIKRNINLGFTADQGAFFGVQVQDASQGTPRSYPPSL